MINELTETQKERMSFYREKWVNMAFKKQFDSEKTKKAIEWLFEFCKIDKPNVIIAESPLSAIIIANLIERASVGDSVLASVGDSVWDSVRASVGDSVGDSVLASVGDSVGDSVWDSVLASVGDSVWDSVGASVRDSVRASVGDSVRASVGASVGASVRASVGASVRDSVRASVGDSVWDSVWASVWDSVGALKVPSYLPYFDWSDFGWVAFYDYFQEFDTNKFAPGNWDNFGDYAKMCQYAPFISYIVGNYVIAVKPPVSVIKNENGILHNPQGPSVEFSDGYCQYYINGRNLPSWIWEKKDTITKEVFLQEKNAEIRGGMYAVLGQKRVFDLIGASEVGKKFANNETYILYRTTEKIGDKHWQWVGVKCPSTGTDYLLGVPDTVTCPIEAVAGTWGLTASEYIINQHT
jgi:hypothetical protein